MARFFCRPSPIGVAIAYIQLEQNSQVTSVMFMNEHLTCLCMRRRRHLPCISSRAFRAQSTGPTSLRNWIVRDGPK